MDGKKVKKSVNKHGFDWKFQDFPKDMTVFVVS